jgi:hypothetical protein
MQTTMTGLHTCHGGSFIMADSKVVPIKPNRQIKSGAEYVSGSPYLSTHPRVLPQFDDLSASHNVLSHETVDAMLADPDVFAGLMLLALMALNEKLLITPAVTDEQVRLDSEKQASAHPDQLSDQTTDQNSTGQPVDSQPVDPTNTKPTAPASAPDDAISNKPTPAIPPSPVDPKVALARDIADFCNRQIDRVPKFHAAMFQMIFEGMAHGNKVAEQVLEVAARGDDAGKWCLKTLKPKPRESIAFVVDAFNNEIGMLGAKPGQMSVVQTTIVADDRDIIPREKFAVFTYRPKDNDPRGQTALLAARTGWQMKQRTWPEYLLFLMVSAIPGILATTPGGDDLVTVYEDDGITPKKDSNGEVVAISSAQFLMNMLGKMRNHQVGVAPDGTNFTLLEANSEGEVFTRALDKFGSEITMALLFQQLATRDSQHQTKGATGSQARVIDLIVFWLRDTAAEMIRYDILKPLVRYNFGEDAADELLPKASYGDTEARDWAVDAEAAAKLASTLTDSQWQHITSQLGIPAPTEAELSFKRAAKMALMTAPQAKPTDGGTDPADTGTKAPDKADATDAAPAVQQNKQKRGGTA